MKKFCFTVDDNIRFLKDLAEKEYDSIFDHPYLGMYRQLHESFGLKVQLNLFFQMEGFDLRQMPIRYLSQFQANAHWLKLSFHSRLENVRPYETADYETVYTDCSAVQEQICRFASPDALAQTTTIHYCRTTQAGLEALKQNHVRGLLGLFGTPEEPRTSHELPPEEAARIRAGQLRTCNGIVFGSIDLILNKYPVEQILQRLESLAHREHVQVMIHEQYFYPDYPRYQSNFREKLEAAFRFLQDHGFESAFYEELIH